MPDDELDKRKQPLLFGLSDKFIRFFPKETQTELIGRINKLTDIARKHNLPVFFTQRGAGKPELEIDPRVVLKSGEVTLVKEKRAPFASTDIDERLKRLSLNTWW